jgi:2-isopropylmalate synthase
MNRIYIFDTTLRDGEQCPGASLNISEKVEIAKMLECLKVDVIEAGFPVSSIGDFEAVREVSKNVKDITIAGLARANEKDIDVCYDALQFAKNKRIHIFLATSDIHLQYKLKMTREEAYERAIKAVRYAKKYKAEIEFSAEDAFRTDFDFLCKVVEGVINEGANVVNIPDTVGYALPHEFGALIKNLYNKVPNIDKTLISVHCHNDLGLGVSNTLSAIMNGARQIECTMNGLGERAGNTALEEIAMILKTRQSVLNMETNIDTKQIYKTSKLISNLTGIQVQRNKAIVGQNAFAHESGIHQHGVLANPLTYEIMTPESIGIINNENIVLGKHSGRHAFADKIEKLGYKFDKEKIDILFVQFKDLADKKKVIFDEDIEFLINNVFKNSSNNEFIKLLYFSVISGNNMIPTATVKILKKDSSGKEEILQEATCGDGPVDAVYKSIDKMLGLNIKLEEYNIRAISGEKDAIGDVTVKISCENFNNKKDNACQCNKIFSFGKGNSTDILEASLKAYVDAINKIFLKAN